VKDKPGKRRFWQGALDADSEEASGGAFTQQACLDKFMELTL